MRIVIIKTFLNAFLPLILKAKLTPLNCFREDNDTTVGTLDPQKPFFSDANILAASSNYAPGLSANNFSICLDPSSGELMSIQPIIPLDTNLSSLLVPPDIFLHRLGVEGGQCEMYWPSWDDDVVKKMWITTSGWGIRFYSSRGTLKTLGYVQGATEVFSFYER